MKNKLLLFMGLIIISCKGQTDLEALKYNHTNSISPDGLEKSNSVNIPLEGIYLVKNINDYRYNDIGFEYSISLLSCK